MPRGKSTNVYLICQKKDDSGKKCGMQNYTTRINKKTFKKLELKKFCTTCNSSEVHETGSEIKHSSGNK